MEIKDAIIGQRVAWLPSHARGNMEHPAVEKGHVTSANDLFIFVKFDLDVARNPHAGAKACFPAQLSVLES